MRDRVVNTLLIVGALLLASVGTSFGSCSASSETREAIGPLLEAPGYPAVKNFSVGTTPVLVNSADVGGRHVRSISCYNDTSNACYWGDGAVDAGVGASYCASGCDRNAPMGGDVRELYIDCASTSTISCHFILGTRYE